MSDDETTNGVSYGEDGSVTIRLKDALRPSKSKTHDPDPEELTIRQLYAEDMEAIDQVDGDARQRIVLGARLAGVDSDVIRRLSYRDFKILSKEIEKKT